jgi:anti-sigma regulatory factor (Ser/Thr protein kinase)
VNVPCLQLDLLALPKAVPELRRTVREYLGAPCVDVQLCVTELVANVIRHVGEGTPVRVRVARAAGRTRVEVADPDSRALPVLRHASDEDESGRGLALLDAVALRWGVEQGVTGKTVWCELDDHVERGEPDVESGGMVSGMATKKYTVTLPEEITEEIRREVGAGGFSPYVTRVMERQQEQDRLGELVAWMEEESGPLTAEELAAAEAERREFDRFFRRA